MPAWSKVWGNSTIRGEDALGMPGRREPLHTLLPLARRLVGIFGAVIEVTVLAVFHSRQDFLLGCAIAFQLVGDTPPRHIGQPLEQLPEKLLRGLRVAAVLHKDIQDVAVLIPRPPQVMAFAMDGEEHLVQMPLAAPLADRLTGHDDAASAQEFFHIVVAEAKTEI